MKSFTVNLLVVCACFALAVANPIDVESIEPLNTKAVVEIDSVKAENDVGVATVRDKRTLLLGAATAAYATPLAYSAYASPLAYTAYSAPYAASYPLGYSAYSAYNPYPYYASSYYVV